MVAPRKSEVQLMVAELGDPLELGFRFVPYENEDHPRTDVRVGG